MGGTSFLWRVAAVIKEMKQFAMALGLEDHFRKGSAPSVNHSVSVPPLSPTLLLC